MQKSKFLIEEENATKSSVKSIVINLLKPSRYQVRDAAFFNREDLVNLANSIKSIGLLQYPRVRRSPENTDFYEIISGHRRVRAASEILGWKEINCEICEYEDETLVFQLSLEENIQRHNLSPYEEGIAFLLSEKMFGFSQDQVAERFHQSRTSVQSKRQLAIAVNSYLKYADSAYLNAFLRHVTLGHITSLSKLDPSNLGYAIKMISRGASPRHIERFANLFGKREDGDLHKKVRQSNEIQRSTVDVGHWCKSDEKNAEGRTLQELDRLIENSPDEMKPGLIAIKKAFLVIVEKNVGLMDKAVTKRNDMICCPKCGNKFSAV